MHIKLIKSVPNSDSNNSFNLDCGVRDYTEASAEKSRKQIIKISAGRHEGAQNVKFSFIASGSERTYTFRGRLLFPPAFSNTLPRVDVTPIVIRGIVVSLILN